MGANDWGVYIENGVTDWQIVQQDRRGMGAIEVSGRWAGYLPKEAPVPLDMTRNMPMLGFYGLKIGRSR